LVFTQFKCPLGTVGRRPSDGGMSGRNRQSRAARTQTRILSDGQRQT
jgi:hypothetical protein